jgi:hypothetical protein
MTEQLAQAANTGVKIGEQFRSPIGQTVTLGQLIGNVLTASIVIAGVVLLFFIIFGGFKMVQGAGNNNPQDAAQGKQAVTYALFGFILVFAAFWIIQLIEAIVGQNFVTMPYFGP